MGPRRCGRGKIAFRIRVNGLASLLQWGRDAVVAESKIAGALIAGCNGASMGPRRCGRGKVRTLTAGEREAFELQWGRDAVVAERAIQIPSLS